MLAITRLVFAMLPFSSLSPENNPSLSSKPMVTFSEENARQGNSDVHYQLPLDL